ncbi:hypothetical protein LTR66_005436, partial [Elasticomyces elasticus]
VVVLHDDFATRVTGEDALRVALQRLQRGGYSEVFVALTCDQGHHSRSQLATPLGLFEWQEHRGETPETRAVAVRTSSRPSESELQDAVSGTRKKTAKTEDYTAIALKNNLAGVNFIRKASKNSDYQPGLAGYCKLKDNNHLRTKFVEIFEKNAEDVPATWVKRRANKFEIVRPGPDSRRQLVTPPPGLFEWQAKAQVDPPPAPEPKETSI